MKNLKVSNFLALLTILISLNACQSTKNFDLKTFSKPNDKYADDLHVIQVKSNRVQQECLFLNGEAENRWRHQYSLYVLTEDNKVIPIMYSLNQDKDSCEKQSRKVEKILKKENFVKICARWKLKDKTVDPKDGYEKINFGKLGSYYETSEPLLFQSICNSKECFDYVRVYNDTCPGF